MSAMSETNDPQNTTMAERAAPDAGLAIALQDILNSAEDQVLVIDTEYRIALANSAAQRHLDAKSSSPIGKLCYEVLHQRTKPCSAPLWDCPLRKVIERGNMMTLTHPAPALGADGYIKITAYPLKDGQGNITAVVERRRDVTAERALESQILRHHHRLLALGRISGAVAAQRDLNAALRIALDNVLEIINSSTGGILLLDEGTQTLRYRVHRGLSAKYAEEIQVVLGEGIAGRVAQTGEPMVLEDVSKDPRIAHPDLVSSEGLKGFISIPLKTKDKVLGVMNVASPVAGRFGSDDVSLLNSIGDFLGTAIELAVLYERLAAAGERYRALLQHALTAQEEERKRIAGELHDETSQAITSLTLNLQALIGMAEMKGIEDAEFVEKLQKIHANAISTGAEIVRLMKELRPTLLDELGLPAAIHRYAKDTLQPHDIDISAEFEGADQRLQPEIEVSLFRIAQGAIGNILEHSGAKKASITLQCDDNKCILRIADDGKGFEVGKLTRINPSGRGAGVFTIKERARLVGGHCRIESQPGEGTEIVVNVPLEADEWNDQDKSVNS
jgi:two-component system NarL family sensor kinase